MSKTDVNETLLAIGRMPEDFKRDTVLLLMALDRIAEIHENFKKAIYGEHSQIDSIEIQLERLAKNPLAKRQAD